MKRLGMLTRLYSKCHQHDKQEFSLLYTLPKVERMEPEKDGFQK